ncbi:hypothetical protein FRB99_008827 [Tulasnella sp. 403]|nr:hypothetical protein FRB99_008827 [Tulasnella sp. 403]
MDPPAYTPPSSPWSPLASSNLFSPYNGEEANLPPALHLFMSDDPPTSNLQSIQIQTRTLPPCLYAPFDTNFLHSIAPNTPPHLYFSTNPPTPSDPRPGPLATRAGALGPPTNMGWSEPMLVGDTRVFDETLVVTGPPVDSLGPGVGQLPALPDDEDPYPDLLEHIPEDLYINSWLPILPPQLSAASVDTLAAGPDLSALPAASPTPGYDVQYPPPSPNIDLTLAALRSGGLDDIANDIIESLSSTSGSSPPPSIPSPITPFSSPSSSDVHIPPGRQPRKSRPRKPALPGTTVDRSFSHRRARRDPLIEYIKQHCPCGARRPKSHLKRHWEESCDGNENSLKKTGEKPFHCAACGEGFVREEFLTRHLEKSSSCKPGGSSRM